MTATTPKELGAQALEVTHGGVRLGSHMWARMPPKHSEVYEKGQVMEALSGSKVKVKLPDGSIEEYVISDLLPCNTESDLEDVCALTFLSEAAVLDCVRERYLKKKIYTWTARILIAMNPFERLPITGEEYKVCIRCLSIRTLLIIPCSIPCSISRPPSLARPISLSPSLSLALPTYLSPSLLLSL